MMRSPWLRITMFSAAVLRDGTVMVWGSNENGFLANGKSGWGESCAIVPVMVEGLSDVKKIAIGNDRAGAQDMTARSGGGGRTRTASSATARRKSATGRCR